MSKVPILFDVNGSFGKGATGAAEFPTIQARLARMDFLGVSRAIVSNVEAVQNHALASNRNLIEAVHQTPGARDRIIPALTVSGLLTYERGGIQALADQMKAAHTRALRFYNVFGRLTLCQLEPVLRKLRAQKPFIVMRHDATTVPDILEFTAMFPYIPLVLTEVMWGPCVIVFDLMRRRRSILADNSWLHSYGAVEQVVKHFGAERLVFGLGTSSHNGAAIAALARAAITEPQRRLIAHGNLDRLLGMPTSRTLVPGARVPNTFWSRFLAGKTLGVDVVDAHGHIGPSAGYVLELQEERLQVARALKDMQAIGINTMMISGLQALLGAPVPGNDLLETLLRPYPGRFVGYVAFNPFYADELMRQVKRYFAGSVFAGFKLLCGYWGVPVTDARFKPMWEYANRRRLPVLAHTWSGKFDSPAMFDGIAKRYPQVSFIIGHSGGVDDGRREAEALARKHRNVYMEWCGSFCSSVRWEETLKRVNPRQVVFGTDAMAHDINWELGRLLSLDVSDAVLRPILGGNMRRILAQRR